jgi:valyl-tRNA synthetase
MGLEEDTEKDTTTVDSLLKAIAQLKQLKDEANCTINALVQANRDSNRTLLNFVGRLEQVTNEANLSLTDKLSSINASLMEANKDFNRTLLNSVAKVDQACEKAALDTHLAAMAAENAFAVLESVAATENKGFWDKLKENKWEKIFDLVVDGLVAMAVGVIVAVVFSGKDPFFFHLLLFSV